MRLGLNLSAWSTTEQAQRNLALALEAERLQFSAVWAAEAYGSDVPSTLAWLAAHTDRIHLGSAIMQIPARQPTMAAMTAATLDSLSGGRFLLGLGVSGPQVSEGWYGVRFTKPLVRTREYVEIIRRVHAGERVQHDGEAYRLPLPGGTGKVLKLALETIRTDVPIYLAALGPRNLELAGEIADGWLAMFLDPASLGDQLAIIAKGRAKMGKSLVDFDVAPGVPVVFGDDPRECANIVRGYAALYIGGMGSKEHNFYNDLARRMGYEEAANQVQDHFMNKRYGDALAAVPFEFIDRTSLLGSVQRVAERIKTYADAGVTTLSVTVFDANIEDGINTLRSTREAMKLSGVGTPAETLGA